MRNRNQQANIGAEPAGSPVALLAARYGVSLDEVRRFTAITRAVPDEESPERRQYVEELARRVGAGEYEGAPEVLGSLLYPRWTFPIPPASAARVASLSSAAARSAGNADLFRGDDDPDALEMEFTGR